jgi:hypothetical protein
MVILLFSLTTGVSVIKRFKRVNSSKLNFTKNVGFSKQIGIPFEKVVEFLKPKNPNF